VESKENWILPQPILAFLEKHFGKGLAPGELDSIVEDFSKPQCKLPTLDEQAKGRTHTLELKISLQAARVCPGFYWSSHLSVGRFTGHKDQDQVILLIQRILLMVADLFHSILQEWRQIAWSRLNPVIKDISM